jgi:peptidoglycan/xylan/chitin deacetylase (PgdA/CDA1 family)
MMAPYTPDMRQGARIMRKVRTLWPAAPTKLQFSKGLVTFSFDDAPQSATTIGADVMADFAARGVYYLSLGMTGQTNHLGAMHTHGDVQRLHRQGHEIGCHSFSHLDATAVSPDDFLHDVYRNELAFRHYDLPAPQAFAYPYGETRIGLKRALRKRFSSARGVQGGLNVGWTDLMHLRAQRLYGEETWPKVCSLLRAAQERKGWAILFTHDVSRDPSPFGCTPELLKQAIRLARDLDLSIVTARDALAQAKTTPC